MGREAVVTSERKVWLETCTVCGKEFETLPPDRRHPTDHSSWGVCGPCQVDKALATKREGLLWLVGAEVVDIHIGRLVWDLTEITLRAKDGRMVTLTAGSSAGDPGILEIEEK